MVLRMRAVDIVEDAGFTAVEATNAEQAMKILEARSDISLLFSDIQMPGTMDGLRLAHAVHDRWPSIKIILVSGHVSVSETDKPEDSRFFGKPLASEQIIDQIRDMIGGKALQVVSRLDTLPAHAGIVEHLELDAPGHEVLTAENDNLRLLLEQAEMDATALIARAGIEAKEREAESRLQKLILEELSHRIKNTLATVSAIAFQSLRNPGSIEQAQKAIEGRLLALGRAHDLLIQGSWAHASLMDTVRKSVEAYDHSAAKKIAIQGSELSIKPPAVIAFAMTLNELCTNATKFGALAAPTGRVDITWQIDGAGQRLLFTWSEKAGLPVTSPSRSSFGTRMIKSLGQQLDGEVRLDYPPEGFTYFLDVPLDALAL